MENDKRITVAITGAAGNMGLCATEELLKLDFVKTLRVLMHNKKRTRAFLKKFRHSPKIQVFNGTLSDVAVCREFVSGADYVLNLASVIPPLSDKSPSSAVECNVKGVDALVSAIEALETQPKLVHTSTMALYGNRNEKHPFAEVGDPLAVSPFDIYSLTKLRGEFRVLESSVANRAVLRQTAMLHDNMLSDNMSDGLMFHTAFNSPLEWATAHDSGVLIARIVERDYKGELGENFWNRCFNIGSVAENRLTGYDVLNDGFALIGGGAKRFFTPKDNAVRNFHGVWFRDGYKLQELFEYQTQSTGDYWREMKRKHPVYACGKTVPKAVIKKFVIDRLKGDPNAPAYWAKSGDEAKITAYFGGTEEYEKLTCDWKKFPLLSEGKLSDGTVCDFASLKNPDKQERLNHGFDDGKEDCEITLDDLKSVAAAHGGEVLTESFATGDIFAKVEWKTQDNQIFSARPYTVLRAGHWYHEGYEKDVWDFDRLAKKDKILAQVWYDSHKKDENNKYFFDEQYNSHLIKGL